MKNNYEKATEIIGSVLNDLSNEDRLRLATSIVQAVAELENCECFSIDIEGNIEAVLATGKSAKYIAKYVKDEGIVL